MGKQVLVWYQAFLCLGVNCWVTSQLYFGISEKLPYCFLAASHTSFSRSLPVSATFPSVPLFIDTQPSWSAEQTHYRGFNSPLFNAQWWRTLSNVCWPFVYSEGCLVRSFAYFKVKSFAVLLLLTVELYFKNNIFWILSSSSDMWVAIFSSILQGVLWHIDVFSFYLV